MHNTSRFEEISFLLEEMKKISPNIEESREDILKVAENILTSCTQDPSMSVEKIKKWLNILRNTLCFTDKIDEQTIWWEKLNPTQKLTAIGFQNWIWDNITSHKKTWHMVIPMGQWKTKAAVMCSKFMNWNTLYIWSNNVDNENACIEFNAEYTDKNICTPTEIQKWEQMDIWIVGFKSFQNLIADNMLDLNSIDLIIIDEADINGLSIGRQSLLLQIIEKHDIYIVWMSATEMQASWKKLRDFFTDEIIRLPMPESLPHLFEKKLIPNITFRDVYLPFTLQTCTKNINAWFEDEELNNFIENNKWIESILDYHITHKNWKQFILWLRNNTLNEIIIEIWKQKGLHIVEFTGETDNNTRTSLKQNYKEKQIDGFVWSRLVWRWLNLPSCEIVYNSILTYSPQLFWQLGWRNMRLDPQNGFKHSEFISFIPDEIRNTDNNTSISKSRFPLTAAAFLEKDYYSSHTSSGNVFDLKDITQEQIQSMETVLWKINYSKKYDTYTWRPEILAKAISQLDYIDYPIMRHLLRAKNRDILNTLGMDNDTDGLADTHQSTEEDIHSIDNNQYYIDYYTQLAQSMWSLSAVQEKDLIEKYFKTRNQKILEQLTYFHLQIIIEIAKKIKTDSIDVSELIHEWISLFMKTVETKYNPTHIWRLVGFAIYHVFSGMERYIKNHNDLIRIPVHIQEDIRILNKGLFHHGADTKYDDPNSVSIAMVEPYLNKSTQYLDSIAQIMIQDMGFPIEQVMWPNHLNPDIAYDNISLPEYVQDILTWLTNREKHVLNMRFGINNNSDYTLEEVWHSMYATRERVRQIEAKGLRRLRHPSRSGPLSHFHYLDINPIGYNDPDLGIPIEIEDSKYIGKKTSNRTKKWSKFSLDKITPVIQDTQYINDMIEVLRYVYKYGQWKYCYKKYTEDEQKNINSLLENHNILPEIINQLWEKYGYGINQVLHGLLVKNPELLQADISTIEILLNKYKNKITFSFIQKNTWLSSDEVYALFIKNSEIKTDVLRGEYNGKKYCFIPDDIINQEVRIKKAIDKKLEEKSVKDTVLTRDDILPMLEDTQDIGTYIEICHFAFRKSWYKIILSKEKLQEKAKELNRWTTKDQENIQFLTNIIKDHTRWVIPILFWLFLKNPQLLSWNREEVELWLKKYSPNFAPSTLHLDNEDLNKLVLRYPEFKADIIRVRLWWRERCILPNYTPDLIEKYQNTSNWVRKNGNLY